MILCYELFQFSGDEVQKRPVLASSEHLERMFDHMGKNLVKIGFLDPQHPKRIMRAFRRIFGRSHLDEREVRLLRGIWSQMEWYMKNKEGDYRTGEKTNTSPLT
jgi:tRNA/rRNA methyltransferase